MAGDVVSTTEQFSQDAVRRAVTVDGVSINYYDSGAPAVAADVEPVGGGLPLVWTVCTCWATASEAAPPCVSHSSTPNGSPDWS